MKRTRMLLGLMFILVLVQWVMTLMFFPHLPAKNVMDMMLKAGYPDFFSKDFYFVYPVISTVLAAIGFGLLWIKSNLPYPGKKNMMTIPEQLQTALEDKMHQLILIVLIFLIMISTFVQSNIAMIAMGRMNQFNEMPFYGALTIMVLYTAYNWFLLANASKNIQQDYLSSESKKGESENDQ